MRSCSREWLSASACSRASVPPSSSQARATLSVSSWLNCSMRRMLSTNCRPSTMDRASMVSGAVLANILATEAWPFPDTLAVARPSRRH